MSEIIDSEYNEFVQRFTAIPTLLEFFHAARKYERDKIHWHLNPDKPDGYFLTKESYKELFNEYDT